MREKILQVFHKPKKKSKCIICGGNNFKRYKTSVYPFLVERVFDGEEQKTDLLICRDCAITFFELRLTDEQMAKLYNGYRDEQYQKQRQKHESYYTQEVNNDFGHNLDTLKRRKDYLSNILQTKVDISSIKTVLDYGGDKGQFLPDDFKNAEKFVYDISGITPIDGVRAIRNEDELKSKKWDFITCCYVFEHLPYPLKTLDKILSLLQPGCYLHIEVPKDKLNLLFCNRIGKYKKWERIAKKVFQYNRLRHIIPFKKRSQGIFLAEPKMHEHINIFNIKTLEYIFNRPGYEIIHKQDIGLISITIKKI